MLIILVFIVLIQTKLLIAWFQSIACIN